jgi:hypothetical protein
MKIILAGAYLQNEGWGFWDSDEGSCLLAKDSRWLTRMKIFWQVFICGESKTVFPASSDGRFFISKSPCHGKPAHNNVYAQWRKIGKPEINFINLTSVP